MVPLAQQSSVAPQPSLWPHPVLPKLEQVIGLHVVHVSFLQVVPAPHFWQTLCTPQPRLTALHPPTRPASAASAHVSGVQHAPL